MVLTSLFMNIIMCVQIQFNSTDISSSLLLASHLMTDYSSYRTSIIQLYTLISVQSADCFTLMTDYSSYRTSIIQLYTLISVQFAACFTPHD